MQESYGEGVAIHTGPELCVADRKDGDEALAGARAGRVLSPESNDAWGADAVGISGRPHPAHRQRKMSRGPTGSETSCMHGNTPHATREIPGFPARQAGDGAQREDQGRRR
jgi:RNA-directed DNA polymerase